MILQFGIAILITVIIALSAIAWIWTLDIE